jgi:hypothetical protein
VKILITIASKGQREAARVAAAGKILEIAKGSADDPAVARESEISQRAIAILQNKERLN